MQFTGRSKVLQLVQTEEVHIRLTAGVSESACDLKKAYPEGATEDLLQEEEEDSSQSQEGGAIRASRRTDWKDELRDIQAARVEREVARFQRTIDETQRRWEENYARAAPRSAPATGHSDSSTEGLHNRDPLAAPPGWLPHSPALARLDDPQRTTASLALVLAPFSAYLVPPRHDLWRTVSVDTLGEPARDRTTLQPLLRHTSVDNLRPSTKVSNLSPLGPNPRQNSMNTVSSLSNINLSNNCGGSKAAPSYQPQPAHGQSVESMSGYSDGESHGDGNDSDVSTSTPDKVPVLPSVRKLASKFDVASRERVNDLDKHGKDGSLAFNGKKNIFIEKSSPTDPPYIRNLTNNLNKRTEKTYNVKEVHSLTARCVPRRFREGLKEHPANGHMTSKTQPTHTCPSPRRDAPSPEHLGIPWGPVAIPVRPTQVHGDTSDDSSAPPGSPRRVPRRRSGGRRDTPGWYARPECGSLTDPAVPVAADSVC
ncbi:hypothetical protein C7M84_007447 [Penaeus vannamei]|uniref:Uncharacterized protein n=1 Tax=Penaeus vannamei TaxID=6689 RepID=A0A423TC82_PENVA|nr:hypothetical protein C7M84_007447 [Penaeus vannamei]